MASYKTETNFEKYFVKNMASSAQFLSKCMYPFIIAFSKSDLQNSFHVILCAQMI